MASLRRSRDVAPNAIVGAARRIHLNRRDEVESFRERSAEEWQATAWRHYDEIGEIKYAYNYFAAIASRIRLYVGYQDEASDTPSPIGDVKALDRSFVTAARYELSKLNNGTGGQPNLIRQAILNLLVAGELYLVGANNEWAARSTSELRFESSKKIRLILSRENQRATLGPYLPETAFVARIWRTHPQYSDDADSSLKGVRSNCNELLLLSRLIRASASSRLNAGILYVADELRFSRSSDPTAEPNPDLDPFEEELTLALTDPVGETDSPSEIVPMLVRGPAEFIENGLKHIDLSRNFDETVIKRHDQMLIRILNGLDIPRDLVTGLANVRYSNAQTISEDMLTAHVEPMVLILCEALTTVFLRTQMTARGYSADLIKRLHVWYDPSEVVTRPDRSEDADKGYERMLVKAQTWRRAHGFSEDDAPPPEELAMRVALAGGVPQSTTLDFLRQLAPDLVSEAERLARDSFGDPGRVTPESGFIAEDERTPIGATPTPPVAVPPAEGSPAPYTEIAASADSMHLLEIMRSIAASARPSTVVRDRTRRLERSLEVERRLRESLHVHLNDVVRRALERAGARTVSKVRGDAKLKSLVSSVSLEEAFSAIPEDQRTTFALNDVQLIGDTIERARTSYFDLITTAQDQGWRALGGHVYDRMKPRQQTFLERSWAWLLRQLTALTRAWLKEPKTEGAYVSLDIVRDATALAGGGNITHRDEPHSGPTGSGKAVLGPTTLDATGWEFSERYRWVYGVSENSYEPHVRLDDTIFGSWEDRVLAAPDPNRWPFVTHHYPGDHNGCRCDWLPEVLDPRQVNAPIAASAPNGHGLVLSTRNGQHRAVETRS